VGTTSTSTDEHRRGGASVTTGNPTDDVRVEDLTIETDDGPMPATSAAPHGNPNGAVVVLQEAFGLTGYVADVAARLARAGWHAVAPALFRVFCRSRGS
jgi:dienelactone hydrolase